MAYVDLSWTQFVVGLMVVTLPVFVLDKFKGPKWVWSYVGLILLMLLVTNSKGLAQFADYINRQMGPA